MIVPIIVPRYYGLVPEPLHPALVAVFSIVSLIMFLAPIPLMVGVYRLYKK